MRSPDYSRLAFQLPAVYHEDPVSFAQIDAYLGLADDLNQAIIEELESFGVGLGPDAALRWPSQLPLDAGPDALLGEYLATYDQVAQWASFTFPPSWSTATQGILQRREFLAKFARLWRRRGTPRGFLDWFCLAFDVDADARPFLLEHFKVAPVQIADPDLTATLFVVATDQFADFRQRQEAIEFANWYAPAHISLRLCWVDGFEGLTAIPANPPVLAPGASAGKNSHYAKALEAYRLELKALLCSVVSVVNSATGIHIYTCIDEGRSVDRLGFGRLPHTRKD